MQLKFCIGIFLGLTVFGSACAPADEGDGSAPLQTTRQALGETVSPDKSTYVVGEQVAIAFAGLPGNPRDWITIAPVGAPNTDFRQWRYSSGLKSGTVYVNAPSPPGQYVARAFLNDGFTLLAESAPFTVVPSANATTTTNKSKYWTTDPIVVSYSNLAGYAHDWLAVAPAGSPLTTFSAWVYTIGRSNGSYTFAPLPPGQYVARSFINNGFTLQAESAPFTVAVEPRVTTDKAAYYSDEIASFSFVGMPGSGRDWIGIAPVGADAKGYVRWDYVHGASGSQLFSLIALEGTYTARSYFNDEFEVQAQSAPFTIQQRPMTSTNAGIATLSVSADKASYMDSELVSITFGGMPGAEKDWIAIAPAGSTTDDYVRWVYTKGVTSGVQPFAIDYLESGSYVARAYFDDGFDIEAESAPFTVTSTRY